MSYKTSGELTVAMTAYETYQDFLHDVFLERRRKNERYSLRSFARSLNLSPAMMTGILQRRKGLSLKSAIQISEKLKLAELEAAYFCDMVSAAHARSRSERKLSAQRVTLYRHLDHSSQREKDENFEILRHDEMEFLKSWYYSVLLEYINLKGSVAELSQMASELNIGIHTIRTALERLRKLGLVTREGQGYRATGKKITTSVDIPSSAIREVHRQFLEQAKTAIEHQSVGERDYSVAIVVTNKEKIAEAKLRIADFRRQLKRFMEDTNKPDALYAVNTQMFSLLRTKGGNSDEGI